jgi:hypothetical protein
LYLRFHVRILHSAQSAGKQRRHYWNRTRACVLCVGSAIRFGMMVRAAAAVEGRSVCLLVCLRFFDSVLLRRTVSSLFQLAWRHKVERFDACGGSRDLVPRAHRSVRMRAYFVLDYSPAPLGRPHCLGHNPLKPLGQRAAKRSIP